MDDKSDEFALEIETTTNLCPVGESYATENSKTGLIPVLSCEGACIRGEIARKAANMIARKEGFARACHAETFTVPDSAMARWVTGSEKVIMIDGCYLSCHGRIIHKLMSKEKVVHVDAFKIHKKYSELFDLDDVPEEEREEVARAVADFILENFEGGSA